MSSLAGRCLCGAVTVELAQNPVAIALCYCLACRAAGGTTSSLNGITPLHAVSISGHLQKYECVADSGNRVTRRFCPVCGSPVETTTGDLQAGGLCIIKMGLFEPGSYAAPTLELFCRNRPEWLPALAETATFAKMPPPNP